MGITALTPVIKIDEEKCINCYACITACPVKYCMDGSGKKLLVNPDLCIGCGQCIADCHHKARQIVDDAPHFFTDLKHGDKMIVIVAPAIAAFFPDQYLNLNGYLKSLGVDALFDVSFGAELTVVSYIHYINEKKPRLVIAQPCPAIVTFIEIYYPELLPYLAPADSPMLHTIKMVREYYPQYQNHKIAVISPCIAKRREFDETRLGDYNVTMVGLKNFIEKQNVNLGSFPKLEYMGALPERAVQFSSPGGLLDTAERFVPGIRRDTRKIEGVHTIYPYLKEVAELLNKPGIQFPVLVDCLNCEKGCNGGTGTGNCDAPLDMLESPVRKRSAALEQQMKPGQLDKAYTKYHNILKKYWKPGLYNRSYRNLSGNNTIKRPNEAQLTEVYKSMKKFTADDIFDCTACGYGSCKLMATAIFNKLNKPENCAHFNLALLEEDKRAIEKIHSELQQHISRALELIEGMNSVVNYLSAKVGSQMASVDESASVTEKMVDSLRATSNHFQHKQESINSLVANAANGQVSMRDTIQSVQGISQSVDGIASAIKIISGIAANTNLLAMNAAIEAAHAGDAGRGFAVVANEIRHLSETTRENSRNISQTLSNIISGINVTSKRSSDTNDLISGMSREINGFASTMSELINTLSELSAGSSEISTSLSALREITASVNSSYTEMLAMTAQLKDDMNDLARV
ncbi:MAG: methyl-accepting chemotaxis protein [Treponema sp.]|nr:methyl-accepting chemotaxis protein [Treponema sp.]